MLGEEKKWRERSRALAGRINFATWLAFFLPLFTTGMLLAAAVLVASRAFEFHIWFAAAWGGVFVLVASALALRKARPRFWTETDAAVRLESENHLHNQLSASLAGIGNWPADADAPDHLRWRFRTLFTPSLSALAALALAAFVPLPERTAPIAGVMEEPLAWQQVEQMLMVTQEENVVPPESLEEIRQALEELRGRDPEEWYSHASLEAGENLRSTMDQALHELLRDFSTADMALERLGRDSQLPENLLKELADALKEAGLGLENNTLSLDPELLSQLSRLSQTGALRQLTPEQLAALRKALNEGICGTCTALGKDPAEAIVIAVAAPGGIDRGPGDAELFIGEAAAPLDGVKPEALPDADDETPALGDLAGMRFGEHEVDRTTVAAPGGALSSAGEGGEAVHRQPVTPDERAVLLRYFK